MGTRLETGDEVGRSDDVSLRRPVGMTTGPSALVERTGTAALPAVADSVSTGARIVVVLATAAVDEGATTGTTAVRLPSRPDELEELAAGASDERRTSDSTTAADEVCEAFAAEVTAGMVALAAAVVAGRSAAADTDDAEDGSAVADTLTGASSEVEVAADAVLGATVELAAAELLVPKMSSGCGRAKSVSR